MNKSLTVVIICLMCLVLTSVKTFAGDIPESLMLGEQQALFIGEITAEDSDTYTIKPLTIMMGDVPQEEVKVDKFDYYGTNATPKTGDYLVVVLLDDNEIDSSWVFKATSDDYKTLRLVSEKYNIVKRYQNYINEGKYFEAQKKLDEKAKEEIEPDELVIENEETAIENNSDQTVNTQVVISTKNIVFLILTILVLFLIIVMYIFVSKKRR